MRGWSGFVVGVALLCLSAILFALPLRADNAAAGSFAGTFSDGTLTLELMASGADYAGKITLADSAYPAKGHANGDSLDGTFTASGQDFQFTSKLSGNQLTFLSGGKTYTLTKQLSNPLASPSSAGGHANVAAAPSAGDFTVLGQTANGRALFLKIPSAATLEAAITQTADALGMVFDAKPAIGGGFADSKNRNRGGAAFTAKLKNQDVRGVIFCSAGQGGGAGSASVVYLAAAAPPGEMATLMSFMPADQQMQTHQFPDGSGSIDLPPGWTTKDQTATYGMVVTGPAHQTVGINVMMVMYEPNCLIVRQSKQTYQMQLQNYNTQMRNYQQTQNFVRNNPNIKINSQPPQKPTPPDPDPNVQFPAMNFCQYCDGAEDVLKNWYPIGEAKAKRRGGPYTSLDKVIEVVKGDPNPLEPGSASGTAYLAVTDHDGDKQMPMRVLAHFTTAPIMKGESWQLAVSSMRGPAATFEGDIYTMNAISSSFKLNMDVVNKRMQQDGAAIRKMGEDNEKALLERGRQFQEQQEQNFNRFESQMAAQEKARHDASSDFIEYIRGVRDVYDSTTGKMLSVDLFNANGIVNGLNDAANDPNRFVQIPLRYER